MSRPTEIIAIGNELLIGDVLDTNTHWLCRRLTGTGGQVRRATMIPDDRAMIAGALHDALARPSEVIFTTGGLGPTSDDMTLSSIAWALGRLMEESLVALDMVQATYTRLAEAGIVENDAMTAERRKMTLLPAGSVALFTPAGAAPGVLLREGAATIICLPGVPEELKGIFEESLQPHLRHLYENGYYAERVMQVDCGDESILAPLVNRVAGAHEQVYVKSRAKAYGPNVRLKITLSARGIDSSVVSARLDDAERDIQAGLDALGIEVVKSV